MNLKQLEYFVAIAEERQITAAARRQVPAVSSAFAERGLSPQVACVMDNVRTCVLWAREGMAVALAPRSLIRVTDTGDQFIKVVDCRRSPTARSTASRASCAASRSAP